MQEGRYTLGTVVHAPFADAREATIEALKAEGFGIVMTIDMAGTLRARVGAEIGAYEILGACNPAFALQAVTADPSIGALLPCNVVVRSVGDDTVVEAMDPRAVLGLVGNPAVDGLGTEVRERLVRVITSLANRFPTVEIPA